MKRNYFIICLQYCVLRHCLRLVVTMMIMERMVMIRQKLLILVVAIKVIW